MGTPHNFCKDPMRFIDTVNISSFLQDSDSFIQELIEELNSVETFWEPLKKSTNRGFQSRDNLFEDPAGHVSRLKSVILENLDSYYSKFKTESCSYIQKWPTRKRLMGWHVVLKQQGHQTPHIHAGGWLSGVIYLIVVPDLGKGEGAIEFGLNGEKYSHSDSPTLRHQPQVGDMIFFPSSLHHKTIPFTTDTERIIVSFALLPDASLS